MSDVVVESSAARTYPVPAAVTREAIQGLRWAKAYGYHVPEAAKRAADILSNSQAVTASAAQAVAQTFPVSTTDIRARSTEGQPSQERVEWAMYGGTAGHRWVSKILSGIQKEHERAVTASLEMLEYDATRYAYLGICDAADDSIVRSVVRVGADPMAWEAWTRDKTWEPVPFDLLKRYEAMELDQELTAFTASALLEVDGVMLMFAEPVAFLPYAAVTSSGMPADDVAPGGHYYAMVDATDTTAVMDVIEIEPGPKVYRRENANWVEDKKLLELLTGFSPPPLVELTGSMLASVLEQMDAAVIEPPEGMAIPGQEDPEEVVAASGALTAAVSAVASMQEQTDERYNQLLFEISVEETQRRAAAEDELEALRASYTNEGSDEVLAAYKARLAIESRARTAYLEALQMVSSERKADAVGYRRQIQESTQIAKDAARQRIAVLETLDSAKPVTAGGGADKNRGNAEVLRRYWLYGKGALKIKWGTAGDWTRCYMYLKKYLGERAKGYCNLRHKTAVGYYPGDKRNLK